MGRKRIADRRPVYVPWRRNIERLLLGYTYSNVIGKGISHVGKMDAILTDSRLEMYPDECDSTKARIFRRSMGREREPRETVGNSTQMTAAKKS